MKIGIDARFYGEAGPGRYVSELLRNLQEIDTENEYTVYLKASNFECFKPKNPRFTKKLANFHWYTLSEQIVFPFMLLKGNFDLVHFTQINTPIFYFKPFVVTIHDLILHEFSTERGNAISRLVYKLKKVPYHLVFLKDIYFSKHIITPSNTTKEDILRHYKVNKDKVFVTYESVDHYPSKNFSKNSTEVLEKYGIKIPYILCLGSFYPHKNTKRLVEAFKILREENSFAGQLVLVGKESPFSIMLREQVVKNGVTDVIFPGFLSKNGYIPDSDVEQILANAFIYVQPALKEGFGIPPVEAMVFGVPATVSNIPCLVEMCGDAALYFDPKNSQDIVSKVEILIKNVAEREDLIKKGFKNIKRFSWKEMAKGTIYMYQKSVLPQ